MNTSLRRRTSWASLVAFKATWLRRAAKLENPVLDLGALTGKEDFWTCDAVVCTLGTTIRAAGSQAAFARVDRDLQPVRGSTLGLVPDLSRAMLFDAQTGSALPMRPAVRPGA